MMSRSHFYRISILFFAVIFTFSFGACRSQTGGTPENLVVVSAPVTGRVRRVLVSEGTSVPDKAAILEIEVAANIPTTNAAANHNSPQIVPDSQAQSRSAEDDLQRASVELQRIEPLVASNNAPQSHLDAARAQYQQAQERLDRIRRQPPVVSQNITTSQSNSLPPGNKINEIIVAVPVPVAGNVRVISVKNGQTVKAGQPLATISIN